MAKLLNILAFVSVAVAATCGTARGSLMAAESSTIARSGGGVSFTLDSALLRPLSKGAKARHPSLHPVKGTAASAADALVIEIARGLLSLTEGTATGGAATPRGAIGEFLRIAAKTEPQLAEAFTAALSDPIAGPASPSLFGAFTLRKRLSELRRHAAAIEAFAAAPSDVTLRTAYEGARSEVLELLNRVRKQITAIAASRKNAEGSKKTGESAPFAAASPASAAGAIPFEFFPQWSTDVMPGAPPTRINKGICYPSYTVGAAYVSGSGGSRNIELTLTANGSPRSPQCAEQLLFVAGGQVFHFDLFAAAGPAAKKTLRMDVTDVARRAETEWLLKEKGVRAYRIATDGVLASIGSILDTVTLFVGFFMMDPPQYVLDANLNFVNEFVLSNGAVPRMGPASVPRSGNATVALTLDPSHIQTGDLLMLMRLDGVDPMIMWGEGSVGGHSVIAVRTGPGRGDLQVCESTTDGGYWPDNGVQCHTWDRYIELCINAGQNVVHVPLSAAARAKFDTNKALDFFRANEGVDYGYSSFLFGWIDTAKDNFPCTPASNYTSCLDGPFALQLAATLDEVFAEEHNNFFRQALAHRAGRWDADPAKTPGVLESVRHAATTRGLSFEELIQIPERDTWLYQTKYNGRDEVAIGRSMVCCAFVCHMWKAGGLFDSLGDRFACGEQTLWDIYSMRIFDEGRMGAGRPAVCKAADPQNPLCQLMGAVTMHLAPDVNTRDLYPNMGERCGALPPEFIRPQQC